MTDFHNFSCTTSQENDKVIGVRISCYTFVMLLQYRVKIFRHKSNTFHTLLALCTMFISITFTETRIDKTNKHNSKSEVQILCSKCPPFTRTHALKRLRHCAIADAMMVWSSSLHSLNRRSFNSFTSWIRERYTLSSSLLKNTPDAVGGAENDGQENDGQGHCRGWKMQDWN